jgi:gliding motility-associated-like protein
MKTRVLTFLIFLSTLCGFAQFSKTHYIPPISSSNVQVPGSQFLYISCPSITPINFRIIPLGGTAITGTVSRDTPYVLNIGNGASQILVDQAQANQILNDKGYVIEAEDLVYASVRVAAQFHAGSVVSKGLAALGTQFRIGGFLNLDAPSYSDNHYTFASILATENNTTVSFSDLRPGISLVNNPGAGSTPSSIVLNSGQSFVIAVQGPTNANRDGLIGGLISSDKPIAVNCGSLAGSNSPTSNLDFGLDQIVSAERTGKDYILVKGAGFNEIERPTIIAHEDNTQVFINGNATPAATLQAGDYLVLDGTSFTANNNLYINATKNVFVYQAIGGADAGGNSSYANQNMHFVPPLTCETPKIINNIPFINQVGGDGSFTGTVCLVTKTGANLNFIINGTNYTLATLNTIGINFSGPSTVTGNTNYETYILYGLTGNVSVFSSESIYLSYFGSSGAATYGGFYSGFTFEPEIAFSKINTTTDNCIPNVKLEVSSVTSFDQFEWFLNGTTIAGANTNSYTPTVPGYYHVKATISACGTSLESDRIPVSACPSNQDGDLANDNIDIDFDNDGITNCVESLGNQNINISTPTSGIVSSGTYNNAFTGIVTNSLPTAPVPFISAADGSFITDIPAGKGYFVGYELNFAQPINIQLEYPAVANVTDLLNSNAEYSVISDINKTVTVLNPTNQLLIDTNFDGIYESGVTQFSSFEIRFRLNGSTPLAAGTATFKFQSYQTQSFKIVHKNLLDSTGNKSTFKLTATCLPFDTDGDGNPNQTDTDSDNDGISDLTEAQVDAALALSNTDTNSDGLDNTFEPGLTPIDSDLDGVADYIDLDSDNDGILDLNEGIADTDTDGIKNYRELDSDNDLCYDVIEAGFLDPNNDGILGATTPPTTNANGQVTSGTGYTAPNGNYIIYAPIVITTQPTVAPTCELENATITLADNGGNTYQWQLSTDGVTWNNIINNATYSGATTNTLTITSVTNSMNNYKYRVQLNKVGNSCGLLSAETTLTVYPKPIVTDVTIIQCDDDLDLLTLFDLTDKNNVISANAANETFTYYTSFAGANNATPADLISNFRAFPNTSSPMLVWARIVNANGCYNVAQLTLITSASQIPLTYSYIVPPACDDTLATDGSTSGDSETNKRDGISSFDIRAAIADVEAQLPPPLSNYIITYYRNRADALNQNDSNGNSLAIAPSEYANFRNDIPNNQDIWVRVTNILQTACPGFGGFIKLSVEKLPFANPVIDFKECDDNQDGVFTFNTGALETTLIGTNQSAIPYTIAYFEADGATPLRDSNGVLITSPFPATFTTTTKDIVAIITNTTAQACFDKRTIKFIVDLRPVDFTITATNLNQCDDEADPKDQNGIFNFTSSAAIHSEILAAQPAGMNTVIKYFDSLGNPLSSPLPNPFTVNTTQTVTVVVENADNTTCPFTKTIVFTVNPTPKIYLTGNDLVCTIPITKRILDAGLYDGSPITDYDYTWTYNNSPLLDSNQMPVTTYTAEIYDPGTYTVEVKNKITGCPKTRTITVVSSIRATILPPTVIDLTDDNTVTINVTGNGNYVYSLDSEEGPYQESNVFYDVPANIYTVWVKDLNGCGISDASFNVLGAPKFFTPNGDGYHDTWNIRGVSANFNDDSIIYIFDRYGKLLTKITPLGPGWNGTFNGELMPATDYWYTVKFEDGRSIKGHFALKR